MNIPKNYTLRIELLQAQYLELINYSTEFILFCTIIIIFSLSKIEKILNLSSFLIFLAIITNFLAIFNEIYYNIFILFYQSTIKNGLIMHNNVTVNIKIIILIINSFILLFTKNYLKELHILINEYIILYLLAIITLLLFITSTNLLVLYLTLELLSLIFYIFTTLNKNNRLSLDAGLIYFILGAFASSMTLFGISLIFGFSGTFNFSELTILWSNNLLLENNAIIFNPLLVASIFVYSGLLFKVAIVPYHVWLPNVYEGALISITAFFAIVPKIAVISILIRISKYIFFDFTEYTQTYFIYLALLSIIIGSFGALYQTKIKKFIAYSAIAQIGFLFLGFSIITGTGNLSIYIYILIYISMLITFFGLCFSLQQITKIIIPDFITDFPQTNTLLALIITFCLFSFAGIPPLTGFYSKLYIFITAIDNFFYLATLITIIISVIGSIYYIRLIKIMFFEKKKYLNCNFYKQIDKLTTIIIILNLFFLIFLTIWPEILIFFTKFLNFSMLSFNNLFDINIYYLSFYDFQNIRYLIEENILINDK